MDKTVFVVVRIPLDLYNLVMVANPGKSFSAVVSDLLTREYSFFVCAQKVTTTVSSVEKQLNDFFNGDRVKKHEKI